MAENIPIKSVKSLEKVKLTNVVNRAASETLRTGENEQNSLPNVGITSSSVANNRKKPCSFQITSVIVGRSNDGGDDSADDLDDISHADDISDVVDVSRITDNETPSLSEDTISKEDLYYNVSGPMSLCSAPVIPTSSQYGLVIMTPGNAEEQPANGTAAAAGPATGMPFSAPPEQAVIHAEQGPSKPHAANEQEPASKEGAPVRADRFKVVKIESTEPFKRGRWTCMDFLDSVNTPFNATLNQSPNTTTKASTTVSHHPQVAQSLPQEALPQAQYYPSSAQQVTNTASASQAFVANNVPQQYPVQMQGAGMSTPTSYSVPQHGVLPQQPASVPAAPISSSVTYNQSGRYTTQASKFVTPVTYSQSYVMASPGNQAAFVPQGQTYSGHLTQAIAGSVQQGQTYAGHAYQMSKTNYVCMSL